MMGLSNQEPRNGIELETLNSQLLTVLTDVGAHLAHIVPVAAIQSAPHRSFA
jgi:hypothetical protein